MKHESNNLTSKTYDKTKKIQQIKIVTRTMIETHGYDGTTNHGIAAQAQVSVGLLYKYFPRGKIDIIHALMEDERDHLNMLYQNAPLAEINQNNYQNALKIILKTFYQSHLQNRRYIQALEIAMLSHPEIFMDVRGTAQEVLTIKDLLSRLQELGVFVKTRDHEDIVVRTMLIDLLIHQYIFFHNVPFKSEEEFLQYLFDLMCELFDINRSFI